MVRFILNFIFFGILFFLIWVYFPEAFERLVGWAHDLYEWFVALLTKVFSSGGNGNGAS